MGDVVERVKINSKFLPEENLVDENNVLAGLELGLLTINMGGTQGDVQDYYTVGTEINDEKIIGKLRESTKKGTLLFRLLLDGYYEDIDGVAKRTTGGRTFLAHVCEVGYENDGRINRADAVSALGRHFVYFEMIGLSSRALNLNVYINKYV